MTHLPAGDNPLTFIWIFLAGLALNLTPCVYPMLTITASIFSRGEHKTLSSGFLNAFTYVLGITVMYSTLGVTAALSGNIFGAFLQSAWVRLLIAALMFSMALSMFGVFRVEAPAFILSRLGRKRVGLGGLFLSGLFVGVFAAPCIGPPVAALLAHVAERKDPVYGFWLFFVMALGLGFPYLLLGTFSKWIKKLPKAGAWMVWVDRVFGVILMGFAVFYLLSVVSPAGSGGIQGKQIRGGASSKTAVVWKSYTPELLADAKKSGKPAVIDFYADWCIPCQEMEATTYQDAGVIRSMDRFERIKVDLTDAGDGPSMDLVEAYQVQGIPTMLFFDAHGRELPEARSVGYIDASGLIRILDQIPSE